MGQLQRRLQSLLLSRRWRTGHAVANSLDRIARRRQEEDPEAGLLLMVREGERLLNRAKERAAVNIRTRFLRDLEVSDPVGTWLRMSLTQPTLPAPFGAHAAAVLAHMRAETDRRVALARAGGDLPSVSVIMPTHQRAGVIGRAISSVLAQTHPGWELIVVDDGSTDGTDSVVAAVADERVRYHRLPVNGGGSAARNAGLALARHPLIAYLDSDNHWEPDNLLVIAAAFRDASEATSAYTAQAITAERADGEGTAEVSGIRFAPFHRGLLENRNYIDLNCFSHRRSLIADLDGFDESMPRLVDWEFILRCTRTSLPLAIPCLLSTYVYGAADDQLTHRYSSADATEQLDRSLFGTTPVAVALPPGAQRLHRLASLWPGPAPAGEITRPVALVLLDEGRGWTDACLRLLLDGQPDLDPIAIITDGPVLLDDPSVTGDRVHIGTLGLSLATALAHVPGPADVLLLTTDVMVMPGAVAALQRELQHDAELGIVIPRRTILPGTDSYAAHTDHHKLDRELDIALSSVSHNVVDPRPSGASGCVTIGSSPLFCALIAADVVGALMLDTPLAGGDGMLPRQLFDMIRYSLRRRAAYVPTAKTYHLL